MAPARPGAGTTQEAVRRHNLGTLLAHLHHDGQLSRAALTERMGLNRSTIGGLVGELVDLGAVRQTAPAGGRTGAGRPSLDVRPSCEDVYVLAAEVGVDALRVARVGLGGRLLASAGGQPLQGVGGYAGELGHLMVNPRGRTCRCGSTGCWETEVGGPAISRALHLPAGDLDALSARLAATRTPSAALRRVGRYLGLGLGSIVNVLNPEVVVLGGVFRLLYPVVREATDEALTTAALVAPREQVRVVVPALGGDAVLVGAAEQCFDGVLADPARELGAACRDAGSALDPQLAGAVGPSPAAPQAP